MSTLTSSPSPAASPRNSFHIQSPHASATATFATPAAAHRSPTASHRSPTAHRGSPHPSNTTFNAHKHKHTSHHSLSHPHPHPLPLPHTSPAVVYAHRGTQYSPDGAPPTAGHKLAGAVEKPPGSTALAVVGDGNSRKRKEASTSAHSSPEPMKGNRASSGGASQQPAEEAAGISHPARASDGTSTTSPELQEARSVHGHSTAPKKSKVDPGSVKVMPLKYHTCNPKDLGVLISNMLMELIRINDRIPLRDGRLTRFHSRAPPGISVADYLQRLIQHATLSPPILLSMVYYIDRLCTLYPAFTINSLTVHRFLITAATVAAKGLSDSFWTNPTYARIGGLPVSELATLEMELLQRVHWKIVPKPEVLEEYYASLVERTDGFTMQSPSISGSDISVSGESEVGPQEDDEMT